MVSFRIHRKVASLRVQEYREAGKHQYTEATFDHIRDFLKILTQNTQICRDPVEVTYEKMYSSCIFDPILIF